MNDGARTPRLTSEPAYVRALRLAGQRHSRAQAAKVASWDALKRAIAVAWDEGLSEREIAAIAGVNRSSVQKHKRKNRNVTQVTDQTSVLGDAPAKGEVD